MYIKNQNFEFLIYEGTIAYIYYISVQVGLLVQSSLYYINTFFLNIIFIVEYYWNPSLHNIYVKKEMVILFSDNDCLI